MQAAETTSGKEYQGQEYVVEEVVHDGTIWMFAVYKDFDSFPFPGSVKQVGFCTALELMHSTVCIGILNQRSAAKIPTGGRVINYALGHSAKKTIVTISVELIQGGCRQYYSQ